jgi:hypothetical protein
VAAVVLALAACSPGAGTDTGSGTASGRGPAPASRTSASPSPSADLGPGEVGPADWTVYHHDPAHTGQVPGDVTALRLRSTVRLDGAVYGSPLVVPTPAGRTVVVATENDTLYGLREDRVVWTRHVGSPVQRADLPCGNIDPLGITGTPVYDAASRLVYAVAELAGPVRHELVAVDPADGRLAWRQRVDPPGATPRAEQQRGALAVSAGRVWVPLGGLEGDCGPYRGRVLSLPTGARPPAPGRLWNDVVPTPREGGVWQAGGVVVGPDGFLYEAVGNGARTDRYDGSDAVIRLSATSGRRQSFFAPTTWADDNARDLDLGSGMPLLLPGGDLVQAGKRGVVYLLHRAALGGIGGEVDHTSGCREFGGGAVSGTGGKALAVLPCTEGLTAYHVEGDRLVRAWRVSDTAVTGSPVVVGTTVLAPEPEAGRLAALDAGTGRVRRTVHVGDLSRFATPAVSGSVLYLGTTRGLAVVDLR